MALEKVLGYFSDRSESVDVANDCSSYFSGIGRIESTVLSSDVMIAKSVSKYCQRSDDEALIECFTCSSIFYLDVF
jgi:hypothetical protein